MILSTRKFFMVLLLIGGSGILASSAFMIPPTSGLSLISVSPVCPQEYIPVCAYEPIPPYSDRMLVPQTYLNKCPAYNLGATMMTNGACNDGNLGKNDFCPAVESPVCGTREVIAECFGAPCKQIVKKTFNNSCHAVNEGFKEYTSGACKTEVVCTNEYAPVCGSFSCTATPGTACDPLPPKTFNNACLAKQGGASSIREGACGTNTNNTGAIICPIPSVPAPPYGCSYTIDSYNTTDIPGCKIPNYTLSCENTQVCTKEYAPVCAQPPMPPCPDGVACIQAFPPQKTYGNKCEANKAKASIRYDGACKDDNTRNPTACTAVIDPVCGVKKTTVQCIKDPCDPIVVKKTFNNSCHAVNEGFKEYTSGACSSVPRVQISKVVNPHSAGLSSATKKTLDKWIDTNVKSKSSKLSQEKYIRLIASVTNRLEALLKKTSNQTKINTIQYLIFELNTIKTSVK